MKRLKNATAGLSEKKYFDYYQLMNRWLASRDEGKSLQDFFLEENIKSIAIYGVGDMADRIVDSLYGSRVAVKYGIDRDVSCTNSKISEIYTLSSDLPPVDAIVVTPFHSFEKIKEDLEKRCHYRLIPLDTVIYSL